MELFEILEAQRNTSLHITNDAETGLRAIIAIHSLNLGPSLGGTRCVPYPSSDAAILDALRLAQGMSYKAALAGLPHGGGKAVIMRPPRVQDRRAFFRAFGRFVDSLDGRYITTEDSGTSPADMDAIREETPHVMGTSSGSGDPSPVTARGVLRGIEASVAVALDREDLDGLHVAIQGVGQVGYALARLLAQRGARLTVADIDAEAVTRAADEFGAEPTSVDAILRTDCDVLSPCALGAVFDDDSVADLRCAIIAGAANNQLAEPRHGLILARRGVLYAPDYVVNAGGLINVAAEHAGHDASWVESRVDAIYDTTRRVLERARADERLPFQVADAEAEALIDP